MSKELKYQAQSQSFIERHYEAIHGQALNIYSEDFSTRYDTELQECSPLIGGSNDTLSQELKDKYNIVGLRQKLKEFNQNEILKFIQHHKLTLSVDDIVEAMFVDFKNKLLPLQKASDQYELIFNFSHLNSENLKRTISFPGIKDQLSYNVIHYEKAGAYSGKNDFYIIKERRIPIKNPNSKKSERPDFMFYVNGIPLILFEYKTEDSGIINSIADFEFKETYTSAPFKVALNDGKDVIFFTDLSLLKHTTLDPTTNKKDSSFRWVNYLGFKDPNTNLQLTNIESILYEFICQPENFYNYCLNACSLITKPSKFLVSARIQQYYALKDIQTTLVNISKGNIPVPSNYAFLHAQRSGKTITMKLLTYLLQKQFSHIFNQVFIYVPDLQIKKVIQDELSMSGNSNVFVHTIQNRSEFQQVIDDLYQLEQEGRESNAFNIYLVNMQKISKQDLENAKNGKVIHSKKILNIIDEAHHGQAKDTAAIRDKIFVNASNHLFTATGKDEMFLYYFPDNQTNGFCNKFTISNAKDCKITVKVLFIKASKKFFPSPKLMDFAEQVEEKMVSKFNLESDLLGLDEDEDVEDNFQKINSKTVKILEKQLNEDAHQIKLDFIVDSFAQLSAGVPFAPKAIVYVNSIKDAKKYMNLINSQSNNSTYKGLRFATDFSSLWDECSFYNKGIHNSDDISMYFEKNRNLQEPHKDNPLIIDILFAVDKYQKGFDLPSLLVTYLDTNIGEPARLNQIYTRTATRYPGKNVGYCVDMSLYSCNAETFQESMLLYDNPKEASEGFINADVIEHLNTSLKKDFLKLYHVLNIQENEFLPNIIMDKLLNEKNINLKQTRQQVFFETTRHILRNMNKVGSPLVFKPFENELTALRKAFLEFKTIYADKTHADHGKIIINLDTTVPVSGYITEAEIKSIINEVLSIMKENHLNDLFNFNYTDTDFNNNSEVKNKLNKEEQKRHLDDMFGDFHEILKIHHKELFDIITDMLIRISDDRTIIYTEDTSAQIIDLNNQLKELRKHIHDTIKNQYGGNAFLFWAEDNIKNLFIPTGFCDEKFFKYIAQQIYHKFKHIALDEYLSDFEKVKKSVDYCINNHIISFTGFISDYINTLDNEEKQTFIATLKTTNASSSTPLLSITSDKDIFKDFLSNTFKHYYRTLSEQL